MRISRAMSCERGSKRPRMHSDIEDANDMYNGVVEESVHVGGTSFHSDDEVGEGVACVVADELNVEECGTESSTSATEDTSDDESDAPAPCPCTWHPVAIEERESHQYACRGRWPVAVARPDRTYSARA